MYSQSSCLLYIVREGIQPSFVDLQSITYSLSHLTAEDGNYLEA